MLLGLRSNNVDVFEAGGAIESEVAQVFPEKTETFAEQENRDQREDHDRHDRVPAEKILDPALDQTPAAVTRREMHAEWPIGLKLEGNYHDIGAFLERVSKFPRIINVGALHIVAREAQTPSATVTAECTAMTFVLVKDEPADKKKGKAAAKAGAA